ncbi:MAG: HAMP domain-containing histidine kinase [Myxococcales bacterium]|nr:HAMP domain-containing histidine kinase [Myxococcales bacterium]
MSRVTARLLRPVWTGPVLFAALMAFALWAVSLSIDVRDGRDAVEQRVRWLRVLTESLAADPTAELAMALEEMASTTTVADLPPPGVAALGREGAAALSRGELDDVRIASLIRALRAETGALSGRLGERWSELTVLVLIALFVAWLAAALYVVARRQVFELDELRADLAARLIELEERDRRLEANLRELQDRDQLLRTVAASIVHEINNPLTYVSLSLSSVQRELAALDAPPEVAARLVRMAGRAVDGADRVAQIARDLRQLTLPSEGGEGPVALEGVLEAAARLSAGRMPHGSVALELEPPLPPVRGDARRLEQVFLNLLLNAADALGPRGGAIVVRARGEDDRVSVEVHDDGPGIDEATLERVFDPFFTTKGDAGTGLGLYVARHIVEAHGGQLTLVSAPDEGTSVRVVLPAA